MGCGFRVIDFKNMFDVITIGTVTRDAFIRSSAFKILNDARFATGKAECLSLGSKIDIDDMIFATGGGATNTAVTFARQGFKVACLCRAGDDSGGEEVIEELEKEGVDTGFIIRDKEHNTAYSIILSSKTGERTILVYRGASKYFSIKDVPWQKLKTKWLYITHLSDESSEIFLPLLDFAGKNGIKVAINPGSTQLKLSKRQWDGILKNVSVLILNREEGAQLTGESYKSINGILKAFQRLMKGVLVLTDGPNGVLVLDGENLYKAGTYPEERVFDRTGAGDAFGSGFVSGLLQKSKDDEAGFSSKVIEYAIKLGSANATSVVEYISAKNKILTKEDFKDKRWAKLEIARKIF